MLFNSYGFIFVFFPSALAIYYFAARYGRSGRLYVILAASLFFYGWWDARFLALLLLSILGNFAVGRVLASQVGTRNAKAANITLGIGVSINLLVLGVFKYTNFMAQNINWVTGTHFTFAHIILPLGISFFTFEEIGYLVDIRRGHRYKADLLSYAVFVAFFPRLVAGPILRYSEIEPQLATRGRVEVSASSLALGLTIFFVGLFKKSVLADGIAPYVASPFAAAAAGTSIDFFAAWGGALAYTCQLYFDFSGYSDMAVGAGKCFGINLPANFASPYKSESIIEFWRRWHMTLSRFLRDYLYISLGGNRRGPFRRYVNLFVTMLLGGLWHGASWTFVCWGGLHGVYLIINHFWVGAAKNVSVLASVRASRLWSAIARILTFIAIVVGWVFFRSPSFEGALHLLVGMAGLNGASVPIGLFTSLRPFARALEGIGITFGVGSGSVFVATYAWVVVLLAIAFVLPNTNELFNSYSSSVVPAGTDVEKESLPMRWSPSPGWAIATGVVAFLGVISITRVSEFLYWQF